MYSMFDKVFKAFYTATSFNAFSKLMGKAASMPMPPPLLNTVIKAYSAFFNVDMSEVEPAKWHSINDFFTRRLKKGARPIAQGPGVLVSPADGTVQAVGRVESGQALQVKGLYYRVSELVGDPDEGAKFEGGMYYTVYLSPGDYHRVHSPVDGRIVSVRYIPGRLFSVNPKVTRYCDNYLTLNERVVMHFETQDMGRIAAVMVGAAGVGNMEITDFPQIVTDSGQQAVKIVPPHPVERKKGQEIGVFNMGSTVVVLTSKPMDYVGPDVGTPIRYGRAVLKISNAKTQ